nr:CDGSH iron-sulfur domain-containing protein [uncultured Rhodopila sp.]
MTDDTIQEARGTRAVVRFDQARCIHARACVLSQPDVFRANVEGGWIFPDAASPDALLAVAYNCPSGAIAVERLDGGEAEPPPPVNLLRIRENGPLALHADIALTGTPVGTRATLCRCGASANKPFCDGSHGAVGFTATGEPPTKESAALETRSGSVQVTLFPNGPLKITGPLEIVSGTGRTVNRTTSTVLCRCGASAGKPYCDGTHKKIGFAAP